MNNKIKLILSAIIVFALIVIGDFFIFKAYTIPQYIFINLLELSLFFIGVYIGISFKKDIKKIKKYKAISKPSELIFYFIALLLIYSFVNKNLAVGITLIIGMLMWLIIKTR